MKTIYLHGFASSPESGKARFFASKLAEYGVECVVPALDAGDFRNLTITGQLSIIEQAAAGDERIRLIGSSLGGYLSALYASRHPEQVDRLVLLAPAFCFGTHYPRELGTELMSAWQSAGSRPVFHYAYGEQRELSYGFITDAANYPDYPEFTHPALIFHGSKDDVVPVRLSEAFAATHANVTLRVLDSDHQLTDVTGTMWSETKDFFGL